MSDISPVLLFAASWILFISPRAHTEPLAPAPANLCPASCLFSLLDQVWRISKAQVRLLSFEVLQQSVMS